MGSLHPKARPAASQEGSGNLHELFKKEGFSWRFEVGMDWSGTIVASSDTAPLTNSLQINPARPSNGGRLTFRKGRIAMGWTFPAKPTGPPNDAIRSRPSP